MFFIFSVSSFGQQAPMGMKYQAVARDLKGNVLADQQITLKITLAGNNNQVWTNYYSETHVVQTSQLGLFTMVVGDGAVVKGKFTEVPWSTEDIWMEVAIKDNSGFATLSNSKLLAVPFAFHAMTANELVGTDERHPGVPGNVWSTFGNLGTSPTTDALGTADNVDMIVITNNIERMRMLANGNINIIRSLNIGANLKVDSNVVLNDKLGSTINNGPLTVARNSPTLLSGTLTVDLATDLNSSLNVDGPTDLNSRLNVNNQKPTKLTGTLQVDGVTTLKDSVFVAAAKPSVLTGTLRVDSNATFKQKIILDNASLDQDTAVLAPLGGALQVAGGGSFGGNLVIGGSARIGGGLSLNSLKVTGTTESTSTTTGAATVAGGVGIAKRLNVGGLFTVTNSEDYVAKFINTADKNGIIIQIGAPTSKNANHFVTFQNAAGNTVGRIQGETLAELRSYNSDYISEKNQYTTDIIFGSLDAAFGAYDVVVALASVLESVSSSTACVGFGACITTPIPSWIIGSTAQLVVAIAAEITTIAALVVTANYYSDWKTDIEAGIGVTYESGSGDYAEYLQKARTDEVFRPGDIVGVKGGVISKNISGADKMMVISSKPIVLGNMPQPENTSGYEKVAFLGQVPVRVFGKVNVGDYIIPNGNNNGVGVAVAPADINAKDIKNIVGIAWSSATGIAQINTINVAVGLNVNDNQKVVNDLQDELSSLKSQVAETNRMLAKLIPGFTAPNGPARQSLAQNNSVLPDNRPFSQNDVIVPDGSNVDYHHLTRDEILQAVAMAEKQLRDKGIDVDNSTFWKQFKNDPAYKESIMNKIMDKVEAGIADAKKMNITRYRYSK